MLNDVLPFFFPNSCLVCGKPIKKNQYACDRCKQHIYYIGRNSGCKTCLTPIPLGETHCGACALHAPCFDALVSCTFFRGAIRTALHRYKFRDRPDLHCSFSAMLIERLTECDCTDFDAIVPVPLSKERLLERGYNQSELIAADIASHFCVPYYKDALIRIRQTARQSEIAECYREQNVRGTFRLGNGSDLSGKHVLLVDDIYTTGATLRETARILTKAGCRITACSIAKTPHPNDIFPEK